MKKTYILELENGYRTFRGAESVSEIIEHAKINFGVIKVKTMEGKTLWKR